jgi:Cu(I)/Ag(I) efflux system membrane fusion protein
MPPELISKVKSSGQPQPVITILAPIGGVVQTLDVRTGMSLDAGMTLARINGLDPVWLEAAVPESQSAGVTVGRRVSVALAAYPGGQTLGKVIAVLPETDQESRTLRVRAELPNRDGRLRAGMAATVSLTTQGDEEVLLVPSEAVIRTGKRTLVLVSLDGGRFHPTEVTLGHEAQGKSAVLAGLREGQSVVTSGQFLIDSEASLKGVLTRSQSETEKSSSSQSAVVNAVTLHEAIGDVESVSASEITLSHGPVESLGWSAMTMPFRLSRPDLATGVKTGDRVRFAFRKDEDGYVIERLSKSGGAP